MRVTQPFLAAVLFLCVHASANAAPADKIRITVGKTGTYATLAQALSALRALKAQSATVHLLPGRFDACALAIPNGVTLRGSGHDASELTCPNGPLIELQGSRRITIARLRLSNNSGDMIRIRSSDHIRLQNNLFSNNGSGREPAVNKKTADTYSAVDLLHSTNVSIQSNTFRVQHSHDFSIHAQSTQFDLSENYFEMGQNRIFIKEGSPVIRGNVLHGIVSGDNAALTLINTRHARVSENMVENNAMHGIVLTQLNDSNTVVYNQIVGNRGNGMVITDSQATIMHNTAIANGNKAVCSVCVDISSVGGRNLFSDNTYDTMKNDSDINLTSQSFTDQ